MTNQNPDLSSTVDSELRHTKHQPDQSVQPESGSSFPEDQDRILQRSEEGNRRIEENMGNSVGQASEEA